MDISDLVGETLTHIDTDGSEQIMLTTASGKKVKIYHSQDCCESVSIVDTQGEWHSLIGKVLIEASEDIESLPDGKYGESGTKTDLTFRVDDATVISKWIGTSNGYYSESVDICDITNGEGSR